jgi:NAD+ synthetase
LKIALAQINTTVGDLAGNVALHLQAADKARKLGADLVVFPELSVTGYPGWDLLEQEAFIRANEEAVRELAKKAPMPMIAGFAEKNKGKSGKRLHNSAALLAGGKVVLTRAKSLLPTYDVFDESRYFEPAVSNEPFEFGGVKLGLTICEDVWNEPGYWARPLYGRDPIGPQIKAGARLLINLSSSPYHHGKTRLRLEMLQSQARRAKAPLLYCNLVGGNDELIFDGNSLALGADGKVLAMGKAFKDDLVLVDLNGKKTAEGGAAAEDIQEIREALVLGLKDYASKSGFTKALVGLSGGIDSALVCALACEALGSKNVLGVSMPSKFSSEGSVTDAEVLAKNLRVKLVRAPIQEMFDAFRKTLSAAWPHKLTDLAEQNLQPRIRGTLLMALSNQTGALLLSTGNKSEISMGYCTLYGDLTGGLAVLADVPKTTVYRIARRINQDKAVIPEASLTKPPSAELKPNQKDQDDLPPYELLDRIIEGYVEQGKDVEELAADGIDSKLAASILGRIDRNEYKRRQGPPGLRITPKAFGIGRKMPLARGFHR